MIHIYLDMKYDKLSHNIKYFSILTVSAVYCLFFLVFRI